MSALIIFEKSKFVPVILTVGFRYTIIDGYKYIVFDMYTDSTYTDINLNLKSRVKFLFIMLQIICMEEVKFSRFQ